MISQVKIPKSHRNEWKSKLNFEDLIESFELYMPFGWAIRDYGIDGLVDITSPIKDSESIRPELKSFLIQLKSTETIKISQNNISFPIPVKKIIQWYSANLPVMFVLNDIKSNAFYYMWINDKLINIFENSNSNWVTQNHITLRIPISNNFKNYTIDNIKEYVFNWKIQTRKLMLPGTYFELKDKCKEALKFYSELCNQFNFESVNNSVNALDNQIEQAIYRIAITGPSRVGKSTLINTLLRKIDISPTGIFQTTGVPIQILPAKENFICITFKNGKNVNEKFSKSTIESYASQEMNEDNKKEVSVLSIHLANRQLEHGVSFYDIPGLDDPDENIYNYTWSTVTKANAILYLIDASPFENGGYIFKSEYKKHILELGQSLDKIFLVFTKINALTGNKLEKLQERVKLDLQKLNLYDKVSSKIYFISAEESLNVRLKKRKGIDTVQKLEDDIWAYLLNENKTGLASLNFINKEIIKSIIDFSGILNARLLDNEKRKNLLAAIESVKANIPELSNLYHYRETEIKKGISNSLENRKHNLLNKLETYLNSFAINETLPDKRELQNYLSQGGHKAIEHTNSEYAHQVNMLKEVIDKWIEENLKQVREIISGKSEQKLVDFSEVEKFDTPSIDLSTSFGVGLFTGIVGLIINPPAALIFAISGFFANWFISAEERRANRIRKIMNNARNCYDEQFKKINTAYMDLIGEHSKLIIDYANKKINLFFLDLQNQTKKINIELSNNEIEQYKKTFEKIEELKKIIKKLSEEIDGWYASV